MFRSEPPALFTVPSAREHSCPAQVAPQGVRQERPLLVLSWKYLTPRLAVLPNLCSFVFPRRHVSKAIYSTWVQRVSKWSQTDPRISSGLFPSACSSCLQELILFLSVETNTFLHAHICGKRWEMVYITMALCDFNPNFAYLQIFIFLHDHLLLKKISHYI